MRISTSMITHNSIAGMLRKQTELANTSNQMGQAKRVLKPSDDPVASAMAFNAKNTLANIEQYGKNIDYARKSMQTSESTLDNMHDRLQRLKQIVVNANSDALSNSDRQTLGLEVKEITGQLERLMNTRDESGNYIFAGSKVTTPPFAQQSDGSYVYQGDDSERKIQISDTSFISPFLSGEAAFQGIDNIERIRSYASLSNSSEEVIEVTGSTGFLEDNKAGAYKLVLDATAPDSWTIELPTGELLTDQNGTTAALDLDDLKAYVGGDVELTRPAGAVAGEEFILMFDSPKEGLLTGLQRYEKALSNFDNSDYQRDIVNDAVGKIDHWLAAVSDAQTTIGTRHNSMDSIKGNNDDLQLYLKSNVSELEDLDYAEATGRFMLQHTALTASQQTFSQVAQLSLFNYIR